MGQSKLTYFADANSAVKDFEKKFKDKTKNNWSDRENFTPHPGKYTMIEVEHDDDDEETGEAVIKVRDIVHPTSIYGRLKGELHSKVKNPGLGDNYNDFQPNPNPIFSPSSKIISL